ncbi:MAG: hypothetical protein OXG78_02585 [Chloroflexi bacterium]|nr:hypothetical protein [Chloroflexota bacterium]
MSGLNETFAGRIEFVVLDIDDSSLNDIRRRLGITAQAQYILVNSADEIVGRWFGILNESQVTSELENLLQS